MGRGDKADTTVKRPSGEQQRRLDIGLGITGRPELLFHDESTTGLDPNAQRTTWELIRSPSHDGTTVLRSSHDTDEVEALAHRDAVLSHGRLVVLDSPGLLGGRDRGQVVVRFTLPTGADGAASHKGDSVQGRAAREGGAHAAEITPQDLEGREERQLLGGGVVEF